MLSGASEVLGRSLLAIVHSAEGWTARLPILPLSDTQVRAARAHPALVVGLKAGHYVAFELSEGRLPPEWAQPVFFSDRADALKLPW
eukprot:11669263-Alexandrium_andersonii.AAC.1